MAIIFTTVFWSAVLILLGIGIILNVIFGTRIPFIRIVIGLLLCYLGISLLLGHPFKPAAHSQQQGTLFRSEVTSGISSQHNIVFGELTIDLSRSEKPETLSRHELNIIFGKACIKLNPNLPLQIEVNSVFGSAQLPDGSRVTFGEHHYQTRNIDKDQPHLRLKANVVFGTLSVGNAPQVGDTLSGERKAL